MLGAITFRRDLFSEVEAKPDLYGPFWICTTIVFLMAMISNGIDWMANRSTTDVWQGDLQKLIYGAAVLYGYVFGAGVALWVWLKVISLAAMSLSALWCIYGVRPPPAYIFGILIFRSCTQLLLFVGACLQQSLKASVWHVSTGVSSIHVNELPRPSAGGVAAIECDYVVAPREAGDRALYCVPNHPWLDHVPWSRLSEQGHAARLDAGFFTYLSTSLPGCRCPERPHLALRSRRCHADMLRHTRYNV